MLVKMLVIHLWLSPAPLSYCCYFHPNFIWALVWYQHDVLVDL